MKETKQTYQEPQLKVVLFEAEQGFAGSIRGTFIRPDRPDKPFSHEGFIEFRGHEGFGFGSTGEDNPEDDGFWTEI